MLPTLSSHIPRSASYCPATLAPLSSSSSALWPLLSAHISTPDTCTRPVEDHISLRQLEQPFTITSHITSPPFTYCHLSPSCSHFVDLVFIILVGPPVKSYATRKSATSPALIAAHTVGSVESWVLRAFYILILIVLFSFRFRLPCTWIQLVSLVSALVASVRATVAFVHIRTCALMSPSLAPSSY